MSISGWWTLALLVLAAGIALLGAMNWIRSTRQQHCDDTLSRAMVSRRVTDAAPPVTPAARFPRLQALSGSLRDGRIERLLLAGEDRALLELHSSNTRSGLAFYPALRLLSATLMLAAALILVAGSGPARLVVCLGAAAAGLMLPKIMLVIWARRRRRRIKDELPMLVDLLRLLQGAGFSMDRTLDTIGQNLRPSLPILGKEIHDANIRYARGRSRAGSLRRLSSIYEDDDLRTLVQLILQIHAHGGAVQDPLRQLSLRLREQRRNLLKERIGKVTVKMTVVMLFTLVPALMLILAGTAMMALFSTLSRMQS